MNILHIAETAEGASGVATFVRKLDASLRASGVESIVCNYAEQVEHVDVVHIHGLWLPLFHKAAACAREKGIAVVWSTHGMTAPWSMRHKRWKKRLAWWLYQQRDLKQAAAIHCTTDLEAGWNKALGFGNCFIVPLGTDISHVEHVERAERKERRLLFVGRIYPVKGLVNLIKAWKILHDSTCSTWLNWKLRIVGPDQAGHQAELESLVRESGLIDSVEFPGPKFGDDLSAEYANCDCLVLPSFTENFGATVVDAMAHGKPVIASAFTPWHELEGYADSKLQTLNPKLKRGWWVSNEPDKLAAAVGEMMSLDDATRREMGANGRRLVEEKYTWNAVARTMIAEYGRVVISG